MRYDFVLQAMLLTQVFIPQPPAAKIKCFALVSYKLCTRRYLFPSLRRQKSSFWHFFQNLGNPIFGTFFIKVD